jgi:hypothetical protein
VIYGAESLLSSIDCDHCPPTLFQHVSSSMPYFPDIASAARSNFRQESVTYLAGSSHFESQVIIFLEETGTSGRSLVARGFHPVSSKP